MCGITGFVDIRQSKKSYDSKRIIEYMTDVLKVEVRTIKVFGLMRKTIFV